MIPEDKCISFDNYVDLDNNLSVCKPLNEIIQTDEVHEVEEVDINGEFIMEENVTLTILLP
jgi:hypothetical protein